PDRPSDSSETLRILCTQTKSGDPVGKSDCLVAGDRSGGGPRATHRGCTARLLRPSKAAVRDAHRKARWVRRHLESTDRVAEYLAGGCPRFPPTFSAAPRPDRYLPTPSRPLRCALESGRAPGAG